MEVSHSKAGSSQISTISSVDWDEIDTHFVEDKKADLSGMVDTCAIMMRYNCGATKAREKLHMLIASGKWEEHWEPVGHTKKLYAKKVV